MPRKPIIEQAITSREMRALELNAEYFGISRIQLMETAGYDVALEVASRFKPSKSVTVCCGLGGNGGDGFVVARHLLAMGFRVNVVLAGRTKDILYDAALANWKALCSFREAIPITEAYDSAMIPKLDADILIDALLGTGAKGKPKQPVAALVKEINAAEAFKAAVDVPTGIDSDTGEVLGEAVKADLTVTFHRMKKGLAKAKKHTGEVIVKSIGIPEEAEALAGPGDVAMITERRPSTSHKGDFGRLLVIGGNETYSGAPALVAMAALRTGVDLAYVAAPEKTAYAISSMSPDLITIKLEGEHLNQGNVAELRPFIEVADAVAIGPGLGLHPETRKAMKVVVEAVETAGKPLLLDADGLKAFAGFQRKLRVPLVLTPHAGEYKIMTGKTLSEHTAAKGEEVQASAKKLGAVVLLKGAVDVIADDIRVKFNHTGNPGMTTGGTGDVLSGIVGAFLAQRKDPFEAAVAGAFVNGAAGDFVFEEKGYHMVASDLMDWIPFVLNDPMANLKVTGKRAETG
jgi:NAD(P)H-hydrate epimerase